MIKNHKLFIFIGIASCFLLLSMGTAQTEGTTQIEKNQIHWQSYDTGIQMIKSQNKKGIIHFYTDWCYYCKLMNKQTFTDQKVIDYLNTNFVSIMVNADKEKEVARKYGANRFPFTWFVSEDTSGLSSQPGFIPPDMLLDMLKFLNTDSFKKMKFSEFIAAEKKEAPAAH